MTIQDQIEYWGDQPADYQATEVEVSTTLTDVAVRENENEPEKVWNTLAKLIAEHVPESKKTDIATRVQIARITACLGDYPGPNAERLVELYSDRQKLCVLYDGQMRSDAKTMVIDGRVVTVDETALNDPLVQERIALTRRDLNPSTLRRDLLNFSRRFSLLRKITEGEIKAAVDAWVTNRRAERTLILYRGINAPVDAAQKAVTKARVMKTIQEAFIEDDLQSGEFVYACLAKFVHSVKRKMLGLDVTWHLMPVFVGGQGFGKSTLAQLIYSPIAEASRMLDFEQMADDRYRSEVAKALVVFVDELAGARKADFNAVKNLITSNTADSRTLGTNDVVKHEMRASFIGTSNFALEESIRDPSGNRRFVGLNVRPMKWDFELIGSTPWVDFWSSIDARGVDPMEAHSDHLRTVQASQRKLAPVEEWTTGFDADCAEWQEATRFSPYGKGWVLSSDAHRIFRTWETQNVARNGQVTSNKKLTQDLLAMKEACPFESRTVDGRRLFRFKEQVEVANGNSVTSIGRVA